MYLPSPGAPDVLSEFRGRTGASRQRTPVATGGVLEAGLEVRLEELGCLFGSDW